MVKNLTMTIVKIQILMIKIVNPTFDYKIALEMSILIIDDGSNSKVSVAMDNS